MGCGTSAAHKAEEIEVVPGGHAEKGAGGANGPPSSTSRSSLLVALGEAGKGQNLFVATTFAAQLQRLVKEHPYLEPGNSQQPHPLQNWVVKCNEAFAAGQVEDAQEYIRRVAHGLEAETKTITDAFRRFDIDSSGNLDSSEFKHMCAYLGWGEEEADLMLVDVDGDGKVTLSDFKAFVGAMGGIQQLFERRRLRITTSRKDVCDFAGLSVGARVRAHFYVKGQKSKQWKEAQVLAVGVERKSDFGPATLGVLLEFGFGGGKSRTWRAKQVVPPSWVISSVEDAAVASALREVGILDEQQGFWSTLLPDSEMQAMVRLVPCQRAALALVRQQATASHEKSLENCRKKFENLGFNEHHLQAVLGWIQDLAPVVVHIHLDKMGQFLEKDEFYRNQFETKTSCGALDGDNRIRKGWEHELFGGAYDDSKPFERCKYGALNVMNDYRGVVSARQYGDSYLVLKDARLRCTFAATDSGGIAGSRLAVLDKYAHVLNEYSDGELQSLIGVAMAAVEPEKGWNKYVQNQGRLQLLRGSSEDPTKEWITMGFPGLQQSKGRYYFEVTLHKDCCVPQVGLLSSDFLRTPYVASATGVGDDEHGWGVDGQNSARWHRAQALAWNTTWPSAVMPSGERALSEDVVVGVAVDIDRRSVWFSFNGAWESTADFGPEEIPHGVFLYPAVSVKGRAGIALGPDFKHAAPSSDGGFAPWPGGSGGVVRLDCPHLGNSEVLRIYKEVQIHGELSLKRNVQRLVAASKYRVKPKTQRSFALRVTGVGALAGTYQRVGAQADRPLYRSENGGVIYWNPEAKTWCMNDKEDFTKFRCSAAPDPNFDSSEPPRSGWATPDDECGVLDAAIFKRAIEDKGLRSDDVRRLFEVLKAKKGDHGLTGWFADRNLVFRQLRGRTLDNEWKQLDDPPFSAEDAWQAAVEASKQSLLVDAGLTGCSVVETAHPYEARNHTWHQEVQISGSDSLHVHFSKKSRTFDSAATARIFAGGLHRNAAGIGARVEVTPMEGTSKVWGTVCGGGAGSSAWTVRLDRRADAAASGGGGEAEAEAAGGDEEWPKVGSEVEARYKTGFWYKAKIQEIETEVDWYTAARVPVGYTVSWIDGETGDTEKTPSEIRRVAVARENHRDLEDLQRYGSVPGTIGLCCALCTEDPCSVQVNYSSGKDAPSVGDEIAAFKLDRGSPMAPISVAGFTGTGPAQDAGVATGWFLDLEKSMKGPSKKTLVEIFSGVGGVTFADDKTPKNKAVDRLLDVIFNDLDEALKRLNGKLREASGVTLHFSDSCSPQQVKLLPEAFAQYSVGQKVGSEIKAFMKEGEVVRPESFEGSGPASAAGVRSDWVLDIDRTLNHNPQGPAKAPKISREELLKNPDQLLQMSGITLVFTQPNPQKTKHFEANGSMADSPSNWECQELPGDVADFQLQTDGDGKDEPELRWGFWALVRGSGTSAPSSEKVEELAEKWVDVTLKAAGRREEMQVEREGWDEARLRALCARHGWEFEWMTEDGERRRRAGELNAGDFGGGDVDFAAAAHVLHKNHQFSIASDTEGSDTASVASAVLPDGATDTVVPDKSVPSTGYSETKGKDLWKKLAASTTT